MKKIHMTAVAAFALLLAGCASVQSVSRPKLSGVSLTNTGTTVAHINATYEGWYFLWLPIFTGAKNPADGLAFAQDTCNVTTAAEAVTARAKELGATRTINMVSTQSSSPFMPIPLLFRWKSATVSADAIR